MKIPVDEIAQSPKEITFSENTEGLNEIFRRSKNPEFGFPPSLDVRLSYYRSGTDLFFNGTFAGEITGFCGRCVEPYSFTLDQDFAFVLTPERRNSERGAEELHGSDLGLST